MLSLDLDRIIISYLPVKTASHLALIDHKNYSLVWKRCYERDIAEKWYNSERFNYDQLYLHHHLIRNVRERGAETLQELQDLIVLTRDKDVAEVTESDLEWFEDEETTGNEETISLDFYYQSLPLLVGPDGYYMGEEKGRTVEPRLNVTLERQYNYDEERYAYRAYASEYNFHFIYSTEVKRDKSRISVIDDPWIVSTSLPSVAAACGLEKEIFDTQSYQNGSEVRLTTQTISLYLQQALEIGYRPIETISNSTHVSMPEIALKANPDFFVSWY